MKNKEEKFEALVWPNARVVTYLKGPSTPIVSGLKLNRFKLYRVYKLQTNDVYVKVSNIIYDKKPGIARGYEFINLFLINCKGLNLKEINEN